MDRKDNMPIWVFLGLMNIYTRKGGLILFWCSLLFGLICVPISYFELIEMIDWSWVIMMAAISAWYWLCIKWVDKHSNWA
jgi:hypothetical protein